jgi:hypothetical protein
VDKSFTTRGYPINCRRRVQAYGATARSSETKPQPLCEPSQNGLFDDCPQRHNAIEGFE